MKRQFVIECDSEFHSVFVYEVTKNLGGEEGVEYKRQFPCVAIVQGFPNPKFYGQLDALLITRDRIEKAAPITPEAVPNDHI